VRRVHFFRRVRHAASSPQGHARKENCPIFLKLENLPKTGVWNIAEAGAPGKYL